METNSPQPIGSRSIEEFQHVVADPGFFCGGGCVAAVTAGTAASLVLLVLGLNMKRRSNADAQANIQASIDATEAIQEIGRAHV